MNSNIIPFKRQDFKSQDFKRKESYRGINKKLDEITEQLTRLNLQIEALNNWFNLKKGIKVKSVSKT